MINIKERNSPNIFVYVFILLFGVFVLWNEYSRNRSRLEMIVISGILLLFLFGFFLRNIEIILDLKRLKVKFKLLGITYRSILIEFDKVQLQGALTYELIFKKENKDILTFVFNTDLEPNEQSVLMLEMLHKNKSYHIGNRKNAKELFEKIKNACMKEVGNIE